MSPVRSSLESHEVVICWLNESGLCRLSSITNRGLDEKTVKECLVDLLFKNCLSNVGVSVLIMPCSVNSHKLENVCRADRWSV